MRLWPSAAHMKQAAVMFICTGTDSILMKSFAICYSSLHDQVVKWEPWWSSVSVDYITHIHWTHYYWCNSVRFSSLLLCSKSRSPVIQSLCEAVQKLKLIFPFDVKPYQTHNLKFTQFIFICGSTPVCGYWKCNKKETQYSWITVVHHNSL